MGIYYIMRTIRDFQGAPRYQLIFRGWIIIVLSFYIFLERFYMSERETGTVKWFDAKKGYGFINREDGEDVFIHYSSIQGTGYRVLQDGQKVEFEVVQGKKGLEATNLTVAE